MTSPPVTHALLTADQERALATTIRAGRHARLLAQRDLAARLRRELPPAVSARAAAAAVLTALVPLLPLDAHTLVAAVRPLLPPALDPDGQARVLATLATWPLDQHALTCAGRLVHPCKQGKLHSTGELSSPRGRPSRCSDRDSRNVARLRRQCDAY